MTPLQGSLRVHQDGQTITFQVAGQATVLQGLPLRRIAEHYLGGSEIRLRVDLRRCTWMDSTFVGTLLLLCRAVAQRKLGEFSLLAPSEECRKLLRQMGVDRICCIRDEELPAKGWIEIEQTTEGDDEFRRRVLQAHQELADLSGPTGETFRKIVKCLAETQPDPKSPIKATES